MDQLKYHIFLQIVQKDSTQKYVVPWKYETSQIRMENILDDSDYHEWEMYIFNFFFNQLLNLWYFDYIYISSKIGLQCLDKIAKCNEIVMFRNYLIRFLVVLAFLLEPMQST